MKKVFNPRTQLLNYIGLNLVRHHIDFNTDANKALSDRLTFYNGTNCRKILAYVIFVTHNFQSYFLEFLPT